jgi:hypothetical protein
MLLTMVAGFIIVVGISHLGLLVTVLPGLAFAAIAWAMWALVLRPELVADDEGLLIVGGWSPVRVAWADVIGCRPTRAGLVITCADGRRLLARYPQKSPIAAWLGRSTKADRATAYILERAEAARLPPAESARRDEKVAGS